MTLTCLAVCVLLSGCAALRPGGGWRCRLDRELPRLGCHNWIVVTDAAYPALSARGVETVVTDAGLVETLETVLEAIKESPRVRARAYVDAEIRHVQEQYAPGIAECREQLDVLLKGLRIQALAHDNLVERIDAASGTYRVLVLKTNTTVPYTSVFLELDYGYWPEEGERALRNIIQPVRKKGA